MTDPQVHPYLLSLRAQERPAERTAKMALTTNHANNELIKFRSDVAFDFLRASACAKIVNVTTNVAALSWFLPHGQWLAAAAVVMAVCNVAGSFVGSHLALKHGAGFVRLAFLGVTSALLAKVAFDLFR